MQKASNLLKLLEGIVKSVVAPCDICHKEYKFADMAPFVGKKQLPKICPSCLKKIDQKREGQSLIKEVLEKEYKVYGVSIQNNSSKEPSFVGVYKGKNKKEAADKAQNDPANRGLYLLDKFFAVLK